MALVTGPTVLVEQRGVAVVSFFPKLIQKLGFVADIKYQSQLFQRLAVIRMRITIQREKRVGQDYNETQPHARFHEVEK